MTAKAGTAYISVGVNESDSDELDKLNEPTKEDLMLDNHTDVEYGMPYQYDDNDLFDVGGVIEAGSIFDDR